MLCFIKFVLCGYNLERRKEGKKGGIWMFE